MSLIALAVAVPMILPVRPLPTGYRHNGVARSRDDAVHQLLDLVRQPLALAVQLPGRGTALSGCLCRQPRAAVHIVDRMSDLGGQMRRALGVAGDIADDRGLLDQGGGHRDRDLRHAVDGFAD
ncbi:hypothetical protein [Methylobacterium sp. CCH7-A2]|uniref:hypothetical protein n=1 Tax=Methylobacterium sp. CCH7-A2 TaxID=1768789 RepID=UPI000AA5639E|nr:hypothetical protein [Methylobacterium sp. CCH7-A2]